MFQSLLHKQDTLQYQFCKSYSIIDKYFTICIQVVKPVFPLPFTQIEPIGRQKVNAVP